MAATAVRPFERTIGAEEAAEGFLWVEDSWLSALPEPGLPFKLRLGNQELRVRIEAEAGDARGAAEAAKRFRIALPLVDLEEGARAKLRVINGARVALELA